MDRFKKLVAIKERETGSRRAFERAREEERSMDELFEREFHGRNSERSHRSHHIHDKEEDYNRERERRSPSRYDRESHRDRVEPPRPYYSRYA